MNKNQPKPKPSIASVLLGAFFGAVDETQQQRNRPRVTAVRSAQASSSRGCKCDGRRK